MKHRISGALIVAAALLCSCASSSGTAVFNSAPAEHPMAKIERNMGDADVRKILGNPDDSTTYITGKGFIPFYYGTDKRRTDWIYEGAGRVVFRKNSWTGALEVIKVIHAPDVAAP